MDSKKTHQSGGFVFMLLSPIFNIFIKVATALIGLIPKIMILLFKPSLRYNPTGVFKYIPYTKSGEGYLLKYLYWCIKISLFLCLFALGGVGITVAGIIFLYYKLFSEFKTVNNKSANNNNTQ